jgi:lipoprotein-releasing system permease protein
MFELFVALRYLVPRKAHLSVSLIATLSVVVISLIVWLMVVFLSVTEGIERTWLKKLTTLNAPLRINPTDHYYNSYYYKIDGLSCASEYSPKTIGQKQMASRADPYQQDQDESLPLHFPLPDRRPDGTPRDPVKELVSLLEGMEGVVFQDFEVGGALMRLQLVKEDGSQGYLTQVSYVASLPDAAPDFESLLIPPNEQDVTHLLQLASRSIELSRQDAPVAMRKNAPERTLERIQEIFSKVHIEQLKSHYPFWQLPLALLPEGVWFQATLHERDGVIRRVDIPQSNLRCDAAICRKADALLIKVGDLPPEKAERVPVLLSQGEMLLDVEAQRATARGEGCQFTVHGQLQGHTLRGEVGLEGLDVVKAKRLSPDLISKDEEAAPVLLAKALASSGVHVGDRGYLSYASSTSSSLQEHRLPIIVSGFYDPGVLSVGNKCILVPHAVTQTINASSASFNIEKTEANGILVWFSDLKQAPLFKERIAAALSQEGLDAYWKVTSFYEYDFARDLLQQFQSDKTLLMLVGILILVVGCCNIISMLVLLVGDKKKEIGILQAMGASRWSIAAIFGCCGAVLGILSSLIGVVAGLFTLRHIDSVAYLLSLLQGHDAFNPTFFGQSLPSEVSSSALVFVLIATPLLSVLAGLIPAIKACRLHPSELVRSS